MNPFNNPSTYNPIIYYNSTTHPPPMYANTDISSIYNSSTPHSTTHFPSIYNSNTYLPSSSTYPLTYPPSTYPPSTCPPSTCPPSTCPPSTCPPSTYSHSTTHSPLPYNTMYNSNTQSYFDSFTN